MTRFFRISKWLHKYIGFLLILYGMLMGLSGILVNHPEWIAGLSVPRWLIPPQYHPVDFDRETLKQLIYSTRDPQRAYLAGTEGVWRTADGGRTFHPMIEGFPDTPATRTTNAILLIESNSDVLLAGTDIGLFACDPKYGQWTRIHLGDDEEPIRSILNVGDSLLVFTTSAIWRCSTDDALLRFQQIESTRLVEPNGDAYDVSLVRLFFDLHSGSIMGLPGRLLFDVAGLAIIFLCFSAFYVWYYPWRRRRRARASRPGRRRKTTRSASFSSFKRPSGRFKPGQSVFRFLFKYHLKIGIWIAPILVIMAGTGLFMRPPLLMIPAMGTVPVAWYPGLPAVESWRGRIYRAFHDSSRQRIIIEASDGFWAVPDHDFSQSFRSIDLPIPIHVMGSNVLDVDESGALIAGSFSGGFRLDLHTGRVNDLFTGDEAHEVSTMRSAENMVTSIFTTPQGEMFATTFHDGVMAVNGAHRSGRFEMPASMAEQYRMPLWHYMFEVHNGRFFRDWIGRWYQLVPILGSLLFLLLTVSGIYDWVMIRLVFPSRARSDANPN